MTQTTSQSGEGDLVQVSLSALEHYAYCPRQCGLILLEDAFTDDAATVRGTLNTIDPDTDSIRLYRLPPKGFDNVQTLGIAQVQSHREDLVL